MATTTNFGWETPDDTDLVKDGALAIRTLGSAIDTSLVDLKGGTTGQVLSKTSNTDMDFTWVTSDDANAIQNAIVDAKGDLITATAADTPARLAVGTNDQVLTADSSTATGLKWATPAAGGYTLLTSGTLSSSEVVISSLSTAYRDLVLVIQNYKPANDNSAIYFALNNDRNNRYTWAYNSNSDTAQSFSNNYFLGGRGNDNSVATGLNIMTIPDYANTTTWKMGTIQSIEVNATTTTQFNFMRSQFFYNQTSAITGINIIDSGGSFTSGNYYVYGVK